jgi:hypothetical protein
MTFLEMQTPPGLIQKIGTFDGQKTTFQYFFATNSSAAVQIPGFKRRSGNITLLALLLK